MLAPPWVTCGKSSDDEAADPTDPTGSADLVTPVLTYKNNWPFFLIIFLPMYSIDLNSTVFEV